MCDGSRRRAEENVPGRGEEGGGQNEDENRRTQVEIVGEDLPPLRGSSPRTQKRL